MMVVAVPRSLRRPMVVTAAPAGSRPPDHHGADQGDHGVGCHFDPAGVGHDVMRRQCQQAGQGTDDGDGRCRLHHGGDQAGDQAMGNAGPSGGEPSGDDDLAVTGADGVEDAVEERGQDDGGGRLPRAGVLHDRQVLAQLPGQMALKGKGPGSRRTQRLGQGGFGRAASAGHQGGKGPRRRQGENKQRQGFHHWHEMVARLGVTIPPKMVWPVSGAMVTRQFSEPGPVKATALSSGKSMSM